MADVDMTDANPSEDKGKSVTKTAKPSGADGAVDNKKKFEVKKVRFARREGNELD